MDENDGTGNSPGRLSLPVRSCSVAGAAAGTHGIAHNVSGVATGAARAQTA
jgi:hypothetical protein